MGLYKVYVEARVEEVYLVEANSDQEAREAFWNNDGSFIEETDRDILEINEVKETN